MITNKIIPIDLENNRTVNKNFNGVIYFCDIDKTYLDTNFETIKGLLVTAIEFAIDKKKIDGMDTLLKSVRNVNGVINPIYFISASPKEMRKIIEKKLLLDGVQYDGICLRDQLFYIKKLKFKKLKQPFSFKLFALLQYHKMMPENSRYILFGDNTEADGVIYSTFKKIIEMGYIDETLLTPHMNNSEIAEILKLNHNFKKGSVEHIFINRYYKKDDIWKDVDYYNSPFDVISILDKKKYIDKWYIK